MVRNLAFAALTLVALILAPARPFAQKNRLGAEA